MENEKTYIIADFVKILDVPRTTLKDWMTRYEEYIGFEIRGRRKIYFESSLDVLKEIAQMRKSGKNASEILLELSYAHPINVDVTHAIEAPEMNVSSVDNDNFPVKNNPLVEALLPIVKQQNEEMEHMLTNRLHDMASNLHEAQLGALLPIVKRQNEKTERMLTGKLNDMAENLHRNQLDGNKLSKQNARRILLVIALILTLVVALFVTSTNLYYIMMNQKQDLRLVEKGLEKNISKSNALVINEIQKRKKANDNQMSALQTQLITFQKNKVKSDNDLKNEIKEQQKVFVVMMQKYNAAMVERYKNEAKSPTNTFDKEREIFVKKIDALLQQGEKAKSSREKEDAMMLELRENIFELKQKMRVLEEEKAKAEKAEKVALRAAYLARPVKTPQKTPTKPQKIIIR